MYAGFQCPGNMDVRYVLQSKLQSWQESEDACKQLGHSCHLASIHNAAEQRRIIALGVNDDTWIGLNGTMVGTPKRVAECKQRCDVCAASTVGGGAGSCGCSPTGACHSSRCYTSCENMPGWPEPKMWMFSDGTPFTYTDGWAVGEPNSGSLTECAYLRKDQDFKWDDGPRSSKKKSVCKCNERYAQEYTLHTINMNHVGDANKTMILSAGGAKDKVYTALVYSCNLIRCSINAITASTAPPCPPASTTKNGICWVFMCPPGQYHLSPTECQIMTNTTCPAGVGFHSPSAQRPSTLEGSTSNDGSCTPCIPGKYKSNAAPTSCIACPLGYHTSNQNATITCSSCTPGYYANTTASSTCIACPKGKYNPQNVSVAAEVCKTCEKGKYANSLATGSCLLCPAGFTLPDDGGSDLHDELSDCQSCGVLEFSPFEGHFEECYLCLTAKKIGSSSCNGCNPGMYKVTRIEGGNKTDFCYPCPSGYFSGSQNKRECQECPLGYFANTVEQNGNVTFDKCQSCDRGKHGTVEKARNEAEGCKNCTMGRFSEVDAVGTADDCKGCPKGKWSSNVGVTKESACIDCGSGKHGSTELGASSSMSCVSCIQGRFGTTVGAFGFVTSCKECPVGFAQEHDGESYCLPCMPGKYQKEFGSHQCNPCAEGKFAAGLQSINCTEPQDGFVAGPSKAGEIEIAVGWTLVCTINGNEKVCTGTTRCPAGTYELNHVCRLCQPGTSSTEGSTKCEFCDLGRFAKSSGSSDCEVCQGRNFAKEKKSTQCETCGIGKISTGTECIEAAIDSNLPILTDVRVSVAPMQNNTFNFSNIKVHWKAYTSSTASTSNVIYVTIEISNTVDFQSVKSYSVPFVQSNVIVDLTLDKFYLPFTLAKLYVRVRTVGIDIRHSEWSNPNPEWTIASDCGDSRYLDIHIFTNASTDPLTWTCQECPEGKCNFAAVVVF